MWSNGKDNGLAHQMCWWLGMCSCPVLQFSTSETVTGVKLGFFIVLCVHEKKESGVITSTNDSLL